MSKRIKNIVSGEILEVNYAPGMTREARREYMRDFCAAMNQQHVAGSEHVRDFHDGVAQRYRLVEVPSDD